MAVVKIDNRLLPSDNRFRRWGRLVKSLRDVNLSAEGGYALCGKFVHWGDHVALLPGQFLVLAAETGSREYDYGLYTVDPDDVLQKVSVSEVFNAVAGFPDDLRAKAGNSALYAYALYVYTQMSAGLPLDDPETELVKTLQALPAHRRHAVLALINW